MRRRRNREARVSHDRWLVSYADFITLLFAFFVVLYSSSQVDKQKMGRLSTAIQGAFQQLGVFQGRPATPPLIDRKSPAAGTVLRENLPAHGVTATPARVDIDGLKRALERSLAPEISRREVALRVGPEGLVISLREVGFFDSGSADLRPQAVAAFTRIAHLLKDRDCDLRIEGHTDNVPIHNSIFKSNWELSTSRATEIIRLLIVGHGFSPERLSAAGYGEFHPAASNSTEDGRRTNRRIDIVVLGRRLSEVVTPR